jgi:hypothetical protein
MIGKRVAFGGHELSIANVLDHFVDFLAVNPFEIVGCHQRIEVPVVLEIEQPTLPIVGVLAAVKFAEVLPKNAGLIREIDREVGSNSITPFGERKLLLVIET